MIRIPDSTRIFGVLAAVLLAASATAQTQTQCFTDQVVLQPTDWNDVMNLQKFDPALGILQSVTVQLDAQVTGEAKAENTGPSPTTETLTFAAAIDVQFQGSSLVGTTPQAQFVDNLAPFDGTIDFAGPSGVTHANINLTDQQIVTPANLAPYIGPGPLNFPVTAVGASTGSGAGNIVRQFITNAGATVTICYTYALDCNNNGVPDDQDIATGTSQDCDGNGVPDECQPDCDSDGIPDVCETDCNSNGTPDDCETFADCDGNGVPDECQPDCDSDGVPDACETDCNANGTPDDCETFADCDGNGVPDECQPDCDGDGVPDVCEPDCNANGTPDDCETFTDCNANGVPDECDISGGTSQDCNSNGVPDECEPDCNRNGIPDDCDLSSGTSQDCDSNGVPDECQPDCDSDGIPDVCETDCNANGTPDDCETFADCDSNGVPDECQPDCDSDGLPDVCEEDCNANGTPDDCESLADCNANGVPDECETFADCDSNGVPDECQPDCDGDGVPDACETDCNANGTPDDCEDLDDCNGNGVPDVCEGGTDCNGNGILDECEPDCNHNGVPDDCDIASGTSQDTDGDGVPDECACLTENRRQPASLLLYPEFDNRVGSITVVSLTNVSASAPGDGLRVEFKYIDGDNCQEFNRIETLTGRDTLTLITGFHDPNDEQGYLYVFAKNGANQPIVWNHLIGQLIRVDAIDAVNYAMNAVGFRGIGDGVLTDLDGDGIRDLDGVEYVEAPEEILIPRFLGQIPTVVQSELVLVNLSGGAAFTTTIDFLIYNDNEEVFSAEHTFFCWDRVRLLDVSGLFDDGFLANATNDDPGEILGAPGRESGWIRLNGALAQSPVVTLLDPAFYAVLIERSLANGGIGVADLPWELCGQDNGDLLPRSLWGDTEE